MPNDRSAFSPSRLRHLFHRKALASERYRAAFARTLGISDTEAAALAHLAEHGQLTPGELGSRLSLTSGGVTALIHRLERDGHLVRHPHPADKRSVLLTPSAAMVARAEEVYAPLVDDMDAVSARLGDPELTAVGHYLTDIADVNERHADRLESAVRADSAADVLAEPAPGLWA